MKKWFRHLHRGARLLVVGSGLVSVILGVTAVAYGAAYWRKILPGVSVVGVAVGNRSGEEAAALIEERVSQVDWKVTIKYQDQEREYTNEELGLSWDIPGTVNKAWEVGRTGNALERIGQAWKSFFEGSSWPVMVKYENNSLNELVDKIAADIDTPLVKPTLELREKGGQKSVVLVPAKDGLVTDKGWLKREVESQAEKLESGLVEVQVRRQVISLDEEKIKQAKSVAEQLRNKRLRFKLEADDWVWNDQQLVEVLTKRR